jgi:cyclopropane fatty-acyl-phospholipid synthase-like methyltransferase
LNIRFERTAKYDTNWINENKMGPNPLWLLEDLVKDMKLEKGMRVLDMGCGKAITSIFLAKEFGLQVWANDLWISPTENFGRIKEAGVENLVFPIHAEAHSLPYADEFFDAIISIDAYHYFGTSDLYLSWYFQKLAKKGAQIGIVVPGVTKEINNENDLPEKLKRVWGDDLYTFHTVEWWNNHWTKSNPVTVNLAENIKDSREIWLKSNTDEELLAADEDELFTFIKMIATKN